MAETKAELADTKAELSATKIKLSDTKVKLSDTEASLANTQYQLSNITADLPATKVKLSDIITRLDDNIAENNALRALVYTHDADIKELTAKLEHTINGNTALSYQVSILNAKMETMKLEIEAIQQAKDVVTKDLRIAQDIGKNTKTKLDHANRELVNFESLKLAHDELVIEFEATKKENFQFRRKLHEQGENTTRHDYEIMTLLRSKDEVTAANEKFVIQIAELRAWNEKIEAELEGLKMVNASSLTSHGDALPRSGNSSPGLVAPALEPFVKLRFGGRR